MVFQRNALVPVWGTASPDETVTVRFAGQKIKTKSDAEGKWRLSLRQMAASFEGRTLEVSGNRSETVSVADVLVGEVWLCGGQSNMERQLGPRPPQKDIIGWKEAVEAANFPQIRELYVELNRSIVPQDSVPATWRVCSPDTVESFSAVGYFFARDLHQALEVPVGIIHSSWGGTPAEAWTSEEGLTEFPGYVQQLEQLREFSQNPEGMEAAYQESLDTWYRENDPGSVAALWIDENQNSVEWAPIEVPALWEDVGYEGVDGVAWLRKGFDLPQALRGEPLVLQLSAVDDVDTTWVNGVQLGTTSGWNTPREYSVPAEILKDSENQVVVRVLDTGGGGGIWMAEEPLGISLSAQEEPEQSLKGEWEIHFSSVFEGGPRPPENVSDSPNAPSVLYNAMIAPLVPYAIRGAAFYQGESNAWKAEEYRTLFPAMIEDWRSSWGIGAFPFLFVQIAPFNEMPPEIREAQRRAGMATQNTAMVVTIDVGDAEDIHPANKEPVGQRLALAARGLAYGENIAFSGPELLSWSVDGSELSLRFDTGGGELVAKVGPLYGFEIAGKDGEYVVAKARIQGSDVVLSAKDVKFPVFARYAWANVADGNLFNEAGLPASPFLASP